MVVSGRLVAVRAWNTRGLSDLFLNGPHTRLKGLAENCTSIPRYIALLESQLEHHPLEA